VKHTIIIMSMITVYLAGCQQSKEDTAMMHQDNPLLFSRLTDGYWQLWTMRPDGSNLKQLTNSESDKRYPFAMNDSSKILYRTNNNHAYALVKSTGQEERLLTQLGLIGSICQSPVSQEVLIARFRTEVLDSSDLWLVSPSGENQKIITRDVGLQYNPAWSPDGTQIAFISGHGYQTHELILMVTLEFIVKT